MTIGYGEAGGKIILMGEHSVVYGKPAIALPFSKAQTQCYVDFIKGDTTIDCFYYQGPLHKAPLLLKGVVALVNATLTYLNQEHDGLFIRIESSLPPQRGLGSSAAVSVAIVRALFDAFKTPLTHEILSELVHVSESIHHTNPSGLDASTIASEQVVFFEKGKEKQFISMKIDGYLVVADTGRHGQTKQAVSEVRTMWIENPEHVNPILDRLGELTIEASMFLRSNKVEELGVCMSEAHSLLRSINVSDDALEHLVKVAMESRALGAKLTGGGKGGCMIALCANLEDAIVVAENLKQAGASNTWFYNLSEVISK